MFHRYLDFDVMAETLQKDLSVSRPRAALNRKVIGTSLAPPRFSLPMVRRP